MLELRGNIGSTFLITIPSQSQPIKVKIVAILAPEVGPPVAILGFKDLADPRGKKKRIKFDREFIYKLKQSIK